MVERITIMASVQSAKTESAYNMLGYTTSQNPAPGPGGRARGPGS